jgi:hemoglobin-like flavoprotein
MDIQESVRQIVEGKEKFGAIFYERSLSQYPEVQQYYQGFDVKRQSLLLVSALMILERHAVDPTPATELYLQHLGTRHHDRHVTRDVYSDWIAVLLEAMRDFHSEDWTPALEEQWRRVLDAGVEIMFDGYDHRVTV